MDIIKLEHVIYDIRARGEWCQLPYPGHPKGCPNFPQCPRKRPDFKNIEQGKIWYAVMFSFNLENHARLMKDRHPDWSERQSRNCLYWQGGVRANLKMKVLEYSKPGDIPLDIPEACGINVFETMARVGIEIDRHPKIVRKVMLIGKINEMVK